MTSHLSLTVWTVRLACVLYALSLAAWLSCKRQFARVCWTVGLACYLAHVVSAFAFQYHWSHKTAYGETARRTAELFNIRWGGGLYFNYVFTAVWTIDVLWMWWRAESYRHRPGWIKVGFHSFLAFMFLNATVVFASGAVRWLAVTAALALGVLRCRVRQIDLWQRN
jgi:hypothetical protein